MAKRSEAIGRIERNPYSISRYWSSLKWYRT